MIKWLGGIVSERIISLAVLAVVGGLLIVGRLCPGFLPEWRWLLVLIESIVVWLLAASLLPWATFFLVALVQKVESNQPAMALLTFWAVLDGLLAWWLALGWPAGARWTIAILALGVGGLYNLIAANQIVRRLRQRPNRPPVSARSARES